MPPNWVTNHNHSIVFYNLMNTSWNQMTNPNVSMMSKILEAQDLVFFLKLPIETKKQ